MALLQIRESCLAPESKHTISMILRRFLSTVLALALFICCNTDKVTPPADKLWTHDFRRILKFQGSSRKFAATEMQSSHQKGIRVNPENEINHGLLCNHLRGGSTSSINVLEAKVNATALWIKKQAKLSTICCIMIECLIAHPVSILTELYLRSNSVMFRLDAK